MLLVKATLEPSPIHGYGCFAAEFIPKGTTVWVFDPRLDMFIPYAELQRLPEPAKDFVNMYGYVTMHEGEKVIVLCGDHAKHMNHSSTPNLLCIPGDMTSYAAARDIQPGEELTCDYCEFDLEAAEKLGR